MVTTGSPSRGGDVGIYAIYVFDINQPSLPTPFDSVLVSVSLIVALSYVLPTALRFLTLFFRSYFCLIGPFYYVFLYKSLL